MSFTCDFEGCQKKPFETLSKLKRHMPVHGEKRFHCHECENSYNRSEHLAVHLQSHKQTEEERKPFLCEECNKRFASPSHLKRHKKAHSDETPFHCNLCTQKFKKKSELKRHSSKDHVEKLPVEKDYLCGVSGCEFKCTKWTLILKHMKESHPPTCNTCNKIFTRKEGLRNHMNTTGHDLDLSTVSIAPQQKIACNWEGCNKTFKKKSGLKTHILTSHENIRNYICNVLDCERSFGHKHILVRHKHNVHGQTETTLIETPDQSESDKSCHETTNENLNVDKKVGEKRKIADIITGGDYEYRAILEKRIIKCPVNHCDHRFYKDYDCVRHVKSQHSLCSASN